MSGTYIALFRGINVGGRNNLPMRSLASLMASLGCEDVRTYIQSGNVVFRAGNDQAGELQRAMADAIDAAHGFRPVVVVVPAEAFAEIVADCPFPKGDGKALHCFFLAASPREAGLARLEGAKRPSESFALRDRAFYLHAPEGIGRSKVATGLEKALDVAATARNWNTVSKLQAMAGDG